MQYITSVSRITLVWIHLTAKIFHHFLRLPFLLLSFFFLRDLLSFQTFFLFFFQPDGKRVQVFAANSNRKKQMCWRIKWDLLERSQHSTFTQSSPTFAPNAANRQRSYCQTEAGKNIRKSCKWSTAGTGVKVMQIDFRRKALSHRAKLKNLIRIEQNWNNPLQTGFIRHSQFAGQDIKTCQDMREKILKTYAWKAQPHWPELIYVFKNWFWKTVFALVLKSRILT